MKLTGILTVLPLLTARSAFSLSSDNPSPLTPKIDPPIEEESSSFDPLETTYYTRGKLIKIVKLQEKALAVHDDLAIKELATLDCGYPALNYEEPEQLKSAYLLYKKALKIDKALNREAGMAIQYGNLGTVHQAEGQLEKAKNMHEKALKIHESLDQKEGILRDYGNLIPIYNILGKFKEAHDLSQKALKLQEEISGINQDDDIVSDLVEGVRTLLNQLVETEFISSFRSIDSINKSALKAYRLLFYSNARSLFTFAVNKGIKENLNPTKLATIYTNLAKSCESLGAYKDAIQYYTQSLDLDPACPEVFVYRGIAYESMGKKALAKMDYSKALKLDPENKLAKDRLLKMTR